MVDLPGSVLALFMRRLRSYQDGITVLRVDQSDSQGYEEVLTRKDVNSVCKFQRLHFDEQQLRLMQSCEEIHNEDEFEFSKREHHRL